MGRELRVRDRRRGARADRGRGAARQAGHQARRGLADPHQNPDGGWGEDLRSYDDPALAGRGESTASQTAWALLALLRPRATRPPGPAPRQASRWLADTQRQDGSWDEPQFTGTGFPGDFYINYHLYRLVFPVSALGRYLAGTLMTADKADADGVPAVPPRAEPEVAAVAFGEGPDAAGVPARRRPGAAGAASGAEPDAATGSGSVPGSWYVPRCGRRPGRCGRASATAARSG